MLINTRKNLEPHAELILNNMLIALLPSSSSFSDVFLRIYKTANNNSKITTPTGTAIPTINPVLLFFPGVVGVRSEQ